MSVLRPQASSTTSPRPARRPAKNFLLSPQKYTPRVRLKSSVQAWELLTPAHWASPVLQVPVQHLPPILLPSVLHLYLQALQYLKPLSQPHPPNPSMKMKSCELFALVSYVHYVLVVQPLGKHIQIPPEYLSRTQAEFRHTNQQSESSVSQ
jgi:hypothetical protein